MGTQYTSENSNPFESFLLQSILQGVTVWTKKNKIGIHEIFSNFLRNVLENEADAIYLDFDIKNTNGHIKVIGNNAITAFWLSGIIPTDTQSVIDNDKFVVGDLEYTYDRKKKILTNKKLNG